VSTLAYVVNGMLLSAFTEAPSVQICKTWSSTFHKAILTENMRDTKDQLE